MLDDYSSLRNLGATGFKNAASIFDIRESLSYEEATPLGLRGKAMQGDAFYSGEDLGPVVLIDYYYDEDFSSIRDKRHKRKKNNLSQNSIVHILITRLTRKKKTN